MDDVHVVDVAEFILKNYGAMDAMKLQKLCYYAQAWSLAWGRGPMFPEAIEAWQDGPVIRELFARHKGQYYVTTVGGNADLVAADSIRRATVTDVANFYAHMDGQQLSDLTHIEEPWLKTRAEWSARPGDRCEHEIPTQLIERYYKSLMARDPKKEMELA